MAVVYRITHPATGVYYIGSTPDLAKRKSRHIGDLNRGVHPAKLLQNAYSTDQRLVFEQLSEVDTLELARELEKLALSGLSNDPLNSNFHSTGRGHAQESIQRMISAHTGKVASDATKAKMSTVRQGVAKTPEWIDKIVESRRIKVTIDDVTYASKTEAANKLNESITTVSNRIKNPKFPNWQLAD